MKEQIPNLGSQKESIGQEKFINELKNSLGRLFLRNRSGEDRFNSLLPIIEKFVHAGVIPEKEKFILELKKCSEIENKDEFINFLINVFHPILETNKINPKLVESIQAETFIERSNFIKLNEVLSYGIGGNNVHLHMAPSRELLKELGNNGYFEKIREGLSKLANIVEKNENIQEVTATSWLVAARPNIMNKFHFTILGPISEKQREKHWSDDERNISEAYIPREKFLAEYLNK